MHSYSVALVCIRREWSSSHSLTFPNTLHVLIMIWRKGQCIPACLAAPAYSLPAICFHGVGDRPGPLVTGKVCSLPMWCHVEVISPEKYTVILDNVYKMGLYVNTSGLLSNANWQLDSGRLVFHNPGILIAGPENVIRLTRTKKTRPPILSSM